MKQQLFLLSEKSSFIYLASLIVLFLAGVLSPRLMAFLPAILSVGFFLFAYLSQKQFLKIPQSEIILLGLIFLLALLSSLWAPNQEFSIERSFKILSIFLPCALLLSVARIVQWPNNTLLIKILLGIYALILTFLISEKLSDHQLIAYFTGKEIAPWKLNRSFVVTALFATPALFLVTKLNLKKIKKIILFTILTLGTLFAFALTESQTAQLCLIVGLFFLFIFPIKIKVLSKILLLGSITFCLVFPFTIAPLKGAFSEEQLKYSNRLVAQASIIHRFDVWNYAAEKALESPVYGNGIESLRFMKANSYMKHQKSDNALHAHNAVLQIWAEFGLIGILLAIALLIYIFRSIDKVKNHDVRRLYLASFMACFCCSLTGYGVWQSWQLGLLFAVAAFTIAVGRSHASK